MIDWLQTVWLLGYTVATRGAITMPQVVEITINKVEVAIRHDDDADVFVGFCPRFKVYSQGETQEEALEAVGSAVALRLSTAFEHGRINTILRQAGFERIAKSSNGSAPPSPDDEFVAFRFKEGVAVKEIADNPFPILPNHYFAHPEPPSQPPRNPARRSPATT
jgi:predicted RNase H-like HicB family nuclease